MLPIVDNTDIFRVAETYKGHSIFLYFRHIQYQFIILLQLKTSRSGYRQLNLKKEMYAIVLF